MSKKRLDYKIYGSSLKQSWRMITRKGVIYVPDILLVLVTLSITTFFLYLNGLLSPVLDVNRNALVKEAAESIVASAPAMVKLLVSFIILAVINISAGIGFVATRFILIKKYLKGERLNFRKAFKESHKYFWKIFAIKFILFLIFIIPFVIFIISTVQNKVLLPYALTLFLLVWVALRILFFFVYAEFFFKKQKVSALWSSARYSSKYLKHTIFTLLLVTLVSFFIHTLISLIPQIWVRIALSTNALASTGFVVVLFFIIRTLVNIANTIFQSGFIFSTYYLKKR